MKKLFTPFLSLAVTALLAPAVATAQVSTCPGMTMTIDTGCLGESNGWAALGDVTGTTGSTSILWSTGESNTQFVQGLASGEHWVMVTDELGCYIKDVFTIDCEKECVFYIDLDVDCVEGLGTASVSIHDNTYYPTILWSTGATGYSISGLEAGSYWVMVTEYEGCFVKETFEVECGEDETCQLRTQTQGGWGTSANGNNPGVYRDAYFDEAFEDGLTIGCEEGHTLTLTSSAAVQAFLPSGSTARALTTSYTNPTKQQYKNVLAGQLVALTLSVGFDANDPSFGSGGSLADAEINNGTFNGWTVQELLDEANSFIGGCGSSYTASQLSDALNMVNENFVGGTTNNGNLTCVAATRMLASNVPVETRTYPVPANNTLNVDVMSTQDGVINMILMDALGRTVATYSNESFKAGELRTVVLDLSSLNNGSYLLSLTSNSQVIKTDRVIISR